MTFVSIYFLLLISDATSDELLQRITETQSDYEYHEEDYYKEEEPAMEEMQAFREPTSVCPLVKNFYYYFFAFVVSSYFWGENINCIYKTL